MCLAGITHCKELPVIFNSCSRKEECFGAQKIKKNMRWILWFAPLRLYAILHASIKVIGIPPRILSIMAGNLSGET